MLSPQQVRPYLVHNEIDLRRWAAEYLRGLHRSSPVTAEELLDALAIRPLDQNTFVFDLLSQAPQSQRSVTRILSLLADLPPAPARAPAAADDYRSSLLNALEVVHTDLLQTHLQQWLPLVEPQVRRRWEERLALLTTPREELWSRLTRYAEEHHDHYGSEFDWGIVQRLNEALSRHGDWAVDQATAALEQPGGWLEIFAVQLLGQMRHRPAIEALVQRLDIKQEALHEEAEVALATIQSEAAVPLLEARYLLGNQDYCWPVAEALGRLKFPQSEAALLRLLKKETDDTNRSFLQLALVALGTTDGFEVLRQMARDEAYDPGIFDLCEEVVILSQLTGHELPEAAAWQADKQSRQRAAARALRANAGWPTAEDQMPSWDELDTSRPATYRRDQPKVGRNDPCPCGSGKKYKKCCGQNA